MPASDVSKLAPSLVIPPAQFTPQICLYTPEAMMHEVELNLAHEMSKQEYVLFFHLYPLFACIKRLCTTGYFILDYYITLKIIVVYN